MLSISKLKWHSQQFWPPLRLLTIGLLVCLSGAPVQAQRGQDVPALQLAQSDVLTLEQEMVVDIWKGLLETPVYYLVDVHAEAFKNANVEILIPDELPLNLQTLNYIDRPEGADSWISEEQMRGHTTLSIREEHVQGHIYAGERMYKLISLGDGLHMIMDQSYLPAETCPNTMAGSIPGLGGDIDDDDTAPEYEEAVKDDPGTSRSDLDLLDDCKIRLLIGYTNEADGALVDELSFFQAMVDWWNVANVRSLVDFEVELARVARMYYSETLGSVPSSIWGGSRSEDLERFRNDGDGYMDFVHYMRIASDADMCILMTLNPVVLSSGFTAGGQAYGIGVGYADAFCFMALFNGPATFAHEFGHLHGAHHDSYTDPSIAPGIFSNYAHGWHYIGGPNNFRSIMAYSDYCEDNGTTCPRIQNWSNPSVFQYGQPTGDGASGDNARHVEETAPGVGGFEIIVPNKSFTQGQVVTNQEHMSYKADFTVETNGQLMNYFIGSEGYMKAGNSVTLEPGFLAEAGSVFTAAVEPLCLEISVLTTPVEDRPSTDQATSGLEIESVIQHLDVFPNPMSLNGTIEYTLAQAGEISIELYDASGRLSRVLYNGRQAEGTFRLSIHRENLTKGNYLVRLRTEKGELMKPLVIIE